MGFKVQAGTMKGTMTMHNTTVYDLSICYLKEPTGLDTAPVFGWKMRSDVCGQKQSAYEISLAEKGISEKKIWNSGKVVSSRSVGIECNASLKPYTEYKWTLTVYDRDGVALSPVTSGFTTGLLDSGWNGAQWITVYDGTEQYEHITDYTVEFQCRFEGKEANFSFATGSRDNYYRYMVKVNEKGIYLIPYMYVDGECIACKEGEVNFATLLDIDLATVRNRKFVYRFVVTPKLISAYVDGLHVQDVKVTEDMPVPKIGMPGLHIPGSSGHTMYVEKMVTWENSTGMSIYEWNFEKSGNIFPCGYVENGVFRASRAGRLFPKADSFAVRKEIECRDTPTDAKLFVSGLGVFCSYVNGERTYNTFDGKKRYYELTPGSTEGSRRKHYYTYDVTGQIKKGVNTISALVSSGWWSDMVHICYGKQNAFLAKLVVKYADGSEETFVTDNSWKYSTEDCPIGYCSIFSGEDYDATKSMDFTNSGFDDSHWHNVKINREFSGEITSGVKGAIYNRDDLEHPALNARIFSGVSGVSDEEFGTVNVTGTIYLDSENTEFELNPGETAVVDFGYNLAGREAFEVVAEKGTKITVCHGEALNDCNGLKSRNNSGPEGSVWMKNLEGLSPATTNYICKDGWQSFTPLYSFYGFRYVQITADRHVIFKKLTCQVITSVLHDSGSIRTGVEDVNKLIGNTRRGLLSNYLSVPTDCPQRAERVGWTADTQVFTKTAAYFTTDTKSFLEKWLADMRDCQKSDGQYMNGCPRGRCGGSTGTFGWADAGVFVPYYLYKMYGDKKTLSDCYGSMQKYVDGYLASTGKKGANIRYGDWLSALGNDKEMRYLLAVAYYAWVARYMEEIAETLGYADDAKRYRKVFETEKQYFNEIYVNEDGTLKYMIPVTVLTALHLNLIDDEATVEKYVEFLRKSAIVSDYKVQTGFLGTAMVLPVLSRFGMTDVAYKILLCKEMPSWLYSVTQGATTVWERWDAYTLEKGYATPMISLNHYSFGAVIEWLFAYAGGIKPDDFFSRFTVSPEPDRLLGEIDVKYESLNGTIISSWRYEGEGIIFNIEIPANTTATIRLPYGVEHITSANGVSFTECAGIGGPEYGEDYTKFSVKSGSYIFCVNESISK